MHSKIVQIGNSKGVRIPSSMLNQCRIEKDIEILTEKNTIIIKPGSQNRSREGWDKAFAVMHEREDDALLLNNSIDVGMKEWEWK